VIVLQKMSIWSFKIRFIYLNLYIFFMFFIHLLLILIFSFNYYLFYFIFLVLSIYLLRLKHRFFSRKLLIFYIVLFLFFSTTLSYQNIIFKIYLDLNLFGKIVPVYGEVAYILTIFHLLIVQFFIYKTNHQY